MKKQASWAPILLISILLSACSLLNPGGSAEDPDSEVPQEVMDSFTASLISEGFEFCPGTTLEIDVTQIHENPQFNFISTVTSSGVLELEIFGTKQDAGLRTKSQLPLEGEGQAGVCLFKSSGIMDLDITGRLLPGQDGQPNMLFAGQCGTEVKSKPPCGDFGMIPFEEAVHVVLPYKDGGSFEWDWSNRNVGVSGNAKWTLHIPCEN